MVVHWTPKSFPAHGLEHGHGQLHYSKRKLGEVVGGGGGGQAVHMRLCLNMDQGFETKQ